jgi:predicted phosphoribosyltransferase
MQFKNRAEAGRQLARKLSAYANRGDVLVLALTPGGMAVASEVARALNAPLDFLMVRKLGLPGNEELIFGAIASGGTYVLNDVARSLHIPKRVVDSVVTKEQEELKRRERLYHRDRPVPDVHGRTVILVDDGLATGCTLCAALDALREEGPARVIVAVPLATSEACEECDTDETISLLEPVPFGVERWYEDFPELTDDQVGRILENTEQQELLESQTR